MTICFCGKDPDDRKTLKIYFAGSIRGGRDDRELYMKIIRHLRKFGEVLTEHIGEEEISAMGEALLTDREIYDRDMAWLMSSDVVVAEVTTPSLGVGYEIAMAAAVQKKVLCLYRPGEGRRLSAMISGCPGIRIVEYLREEELFPVLDEFFVMKKTG
jgi:nucleoside 2-deoxyribosyltransferase